VEEEIDKTSKRVRDRTPGCGEILSSHHLQRGGLFVGAEGGKTFVYQGISMSAVRGEEYRKKDANSGHWLSRLEKRGR